MNGLAVVGSLFESVLVIKAECALTLSLSPSLFPSYSFSLSFSFTYPAPRPPILSLVLLPWDDTTRKQEGPYHWPVPTPGHSQPLELQVEYISIVYR